MHNLGCITDHFELFVMWSHGMTNLQKNGVTVNGSPDSSKGVCDRLDDMEN